MRPWPSVRQRPVQIHREFKGIDKRDALSITDAYSGDTINLGNSRYPAVTTRPGYTIVGDFGGTILGMGVWQEKELHVVWSDGKWRRLNANNTWTELASGLDTTADYSFTNFKGNLSTICLIATNGVHARKYDGTAVTTLTGIPAGAKYITQFADRLWAAKGNTLHFSAYRMADDWTQAEGDETDAGFIEIESPDGEEINSLQGGLNKLTITKPSAVYTLYGYSPADYSVRPATTDTGQLNHKSASTMDGWLFQLYDNGFYQFPGSGAPTSTFSERIRDYFIKLNQTGKRSSALGNDGNRLYLSLPVNSSVVDTLIEYDPRKDTYFPWTGLYALDFAQIESKFYIGTTNGRVILVGGATDNGAPIPWRWVSRPFTGQSMAQKIRWLRMWVTVDLPAGSTFSVFISETEMGDDGWVQAGTTVTGNGSIIRKPIYFPPGVASNPSSNAHCIRVKFEGTGPMTLYEFAYEEDQYPMR